MIILVNRLLHEPLLFLATAAGAAVILLPADFANPIVAVCVMAARNSVKPVLPKVRVSK